MLHRLSGPARGVIVAAFVAVFVGLRLTELRQIPRSLVVVRWAVVGCVLGAGYTALIASWERVAERRDLERVGRYVLLATVVGATVVGATYVFPGTAGTVRFFGTFVGYLLVARLVGYFPFGSGSASAPTTAG